MSLSPLFTIFNPVQETSQISLSFIKKETWQRNSKSSRFWQNNTMIRAKVGEIHFPIHSRWHQLNEVSVTRCFWLFTGFRPTLNVPKKRFVPVTLFSVNHLTNFQRRSRNLLSYFTAPFASYAFTVFLQAFKRLIWNSNFENYSKYHLVYEKFHTEARFPVFFFFFLNFRFDRISGTDLVVSTQSSV